eukprot:scaffold7207_cov62-Phaeocystis_antarctica.AAC.7
MPHVARGQHLPILATVLLHFAPECGVQVATLGLARPVVADIQVADSARGEHGISRRAGGWVSGSNGGGGLPHDVEVRAVRVE